MKIAEALILRADIQKRIAQLKTRLNNNAKVQEHEEPTENPQLLLTELDSLISQLNDLIIKINKTNTLSKITAGKLDYWFDWRIKKYNLNKF